MCWGEPDTPQIQTLPPPNPPGWAMPYMDNPQGNS